MTRFARASGSKASNARTPEEATSWSTMKRQMIESKQQKEGNTYEKIISSAILKSNNKSSLTTPVNKVWEVFDNDSKECVSSTKNSAKDTANISACSKNIKKRKNKNSGNENIKVSGSAIELEKYSVGGNTFIVSSKDKKEKIVNDGSNTAVAVGNDRPKEKKKVTAFSNYITKPKNGVPEVNIDNKNSKNLLERNKSVMKERKRSKLNENSQEIKTKNDNKVKRKRDVNNFNPVASRFNDQVGHKQIKTNHDRSSSCNFKNFNYNRTSTMNIGGRIIEISDFQGFAVKKEDAVRLSKLRKDLLAKGVPRKEVEIALKAERRRAEKALAREKKVVCFKCRKFGHNMSECPECDDPTDVCFKCGSTEHSVRDCRVIQNDSFRYAHCFICQEQGHIARQCPDNPRGLYPKGGACKVCGDVTHLKKDCPELINEKEKSTITVSTVQNNSIEVLDEDLNQEIKKKTGVKKTSLVKF